MPIQCTLSTRQQISGYVVVKKNYNAEYILTDSLIPIYLPNKHLLVEKMVSLIGQIGCKVATFDEAREMLEIRK